jgi:hypothetical protein
MAGPTELEEPEQPTVSLNSDRDLMIRFHMALEAIAEMGVYDAADARKMKSIASRALNRKIT